MKITGSINDNALITRSLLNTTDVLNNATASIHISQELLDYCFNALEENVQRLSYSVFLSDAFFQARNSSKIGSLIIAAGLNCSRGGNGTLPVGVNTTFRFRKNNYVYISH